MSDKNNARANMSQAMRNILEVIESQGQFLKEDETFLMISTSGGLDIFDPENQDKKIATVHAVRGDAEAVAVSLDDFMVNSEEGNHITDVLFKIRAKMGIMKSMDGHKN